MWKDNRSTQSTPDIWYGYLLRDTGPSHVHTKILGPDGQQIQSYQLFDGRLRPRQTVAVSASGTGRIFTDTQYDTIGAAAKTSTFYNSSDFTGYDGTLVTFNDKDIANQQRFTYDNLGRATAQQQWYGNGTISTKLFETVSAYNGDRTIATTPPAGGTATTVVKDARGQTVELRQHQGGTPAGAYIATTYTYNRVGQLTTVKDPALNTWSYSYDLLGRKTQTVDPDAGTSSSAYDNAGQVLSTTDGRGQQLFYTYDLLGRKTTERITSATGQIQADWVYDTAVFDGTTTQVKGQLASTTRYIAGTPTYINAVGSYNNAYQPLTTIDTTPEPSRV